MAAMQATPEQIRDFFQTRSRAILTTRRKDGGLQSSPVRVALDGDGRVVISSRSATVKVRNLARDQRAALCVISDQWGGPGWMNVEGPVELIRLPEALTLLEDMYRRREKKEPDDEFRRSTKAEDRVVIRIAPERAFSPSLR
jgi:PPOX class probable F420-dependent enzyme